MWSGLDVSCSECNIESFKLLPIVENFPLFREIGVNSTLSGISGKNHSFFPLSPKLLKANMSRGFRSQPAEAFPHQNGIPQIQTRCCGTLLKKISIEIYFKIILKTFDRKIKFFLLKIELVKTNLSLETVPLVILQ